jgi:hypothetical protein
MYTYRRFKTTKSTVSILLIALVLVAWGVLGLTDTPLAKKGGGGKEKVTFDVDLNLKGDSDEEPVTVNGTAQWPTLYANFAADTSNPQITVGGKTLRVIGMSTNMNKKSGKIIKATLGFQDDDGNDYQAGPVDTDSAVPPDKGDFSVTIEKTVMVYKVQGKGNGTELGEVYIGTATYDNPNL